MSEETPVEENSDDRPAKAISLKKLLINLSVITFLGLFITLGFFYVWLPGKTNHGETITVPDLVERNLDELQEILTERGLRYEVNDSAYSSQYPPYTILQQYPSAGSKVKEGRKIFLSVNRKTTPMVSFPDGLFSGEKSLTHVKAVLTNLDIEISRIVVRKGPYFNLVLEGRYQGEPIQDGQEIPKGSSVEIVVADGYGERNFELPSFFGKPFDEADLLRKGIDLNLEPLILPRGVDTTGKELFVIRQKPDPGTEVRVGELITLWVDIKIDSTYWYEINVDTTAAAEIVIDSLGNFPNEN